MASRKPPRPDKSGLIDDLELGQRAALCMLAQEIGLGFTEPLARRRHVSLLCYAYMVALTDGHVPEEWRPVA